MTEKEIKKYKSFDYFHAIGHILKYQIFTKIILILLLMALKNLAMALIQSTGRIAITSGDFKFLFTSWQGYSLIIISIISLFIFLAIDINAKIIYASKLIEKSPIKLFQTLKEAFLSIKSFMSLKGISLIIYIALIGPLVGFGLSFSGTKNLVIPNFISSVIDSNKIYSTLYWAFLFIFLIVGILNIFVIHGVVLDKMELGQAIKNSRKLIRHKWKNYLKETLIYTISVAFMNFLAAFLLLILPIMVIDNLTIDPVIARFILIFLILLSLSAFLFVNFLALPVYIIKLTIIYKRYTCKDEILFERGAKYRKSRLLPILALWLGGLFSVSLLVNNFFREIFVNPDKVQIIGHRAGGYEASENTLEGLQFAIDKKLYGCEIDVQRSLDGKYIINHDNTFSRLSGDSRTPGQMTYEQIKKLRVKDPDGSYGKSRIAGLEEMLDLAKDKIKLFIELKGPSANQKMVDDLVEMLEKRNMIDQAVLIGLDYKLIDYAESKYPHVQTGFLAFLSFGNIANLNCDYLGLEEELASSDLINQIQSNGKKVMVWTPNKEESQKYFLLSQADAIITDNIKQAKDINENLDKRSDIEIIGDWLSNQL